MLLNSNISLFRTKSQVPRLCLKEVLCVLLLNSNISQIRTIISVPPHGPVAKTPPANSNFSKEILL